MIKLNKKIIPNKQCVEPFLSWAGGKRWFVQKYSHLFPDNYDRYIEPFLGSGAVYFHLQPKKAILGDLNSDLISAYKALKENHKLVYRYLRDHHRNHSEEYYYKIRGSNLKSLESRAAKFIYLNRTCWNGLYRVNLKGQFNVPIGTKKNVVRDGDCFDEISSVLRKTKFLNKDFEDLIDMAGEGDLIFSDPPYTVRHNYNGFINYNEKLFSWYDQQRLFYALKRAQKRGAYIVGTNAYHKSIRDLYRGEFGSLKASRSSSISSKVESRKTFEEFVIFTEK